MIGYRIRLCDNSTTDNCRRRRGGGINKEGGEEQGPKEEGFGGSGRISGQVGWFIVWLVDWWDGFLVVLFFSSGHVPGACSLVSF